VLFVGGGARFAIGLTLKPMAEELGWARTVIGEAVALFQVVSAVCLFAAGLVADRIDPRRVLMAGVVAAAVGIGLMGFVTAPWHALVLYGLVFALGNGIASIIPVTVMVTRAFPQRTGAANSLVTSGMSAGQLVMIAVLAGILVAVGWRSVYIWLGVAHLLVLPLLFVAAADGASSPQRPERRAGELSIRAAARTRAFWCLLAVYGICGFDDFFMSTHVVAFAQDRGIGALLAGNLLAAMGLAAFIGVLVAGAWGDRVGPVLPTALSFVARIAVFALILVDQSQASVAVFALVFGSTFLVTAPLTALFVREHFGTRNLGALTGLITMVHHIFGGLGAWLGARVFDRAGSYDGAFAMMLAASAVALLLSLALRRQAPAQPAHG
jgi:predicted MFS family arabinose efflux permease